VVIRISSLNGIWMEKLTNQYYDIGFGIRKEDIKIKNGFS